MTSEILHIYCRVSSDAQVEHGHSMEAQKKAGIARAKSLGLKCEFHEEAGKSAAYDNIENRDVLKKIIEECDEGTIKNIFVTELDRLTRSPIAMHYLKKVFRDNEIIVHTTSQSLNFNDDDQEFMSDVVALLSQRENKLRVKRSKRGMLESALKGRWNGAMHPFGYRKNADKVLVIDEQEAEAYKKMVEMCLKGNGTNTIAKQLNLLGVDTRGKTALLRGTKVKNKYTNKIRQVKNSEFVWRAGTVYCILTNTIYKGERKYKGQIIKFPAIIEKEIWDQVQQQLKKNKNCSSNHPGHFYLLKGLISCSKCGANFYGILKKDQRVYMCCSKRSSFCGTKSINIDFLNDTVYKIVTDNKLQLKLIKEEFASKKNILKKPVIEKEVLRVEKEISSLDKRRENLIVLFEKEKISIEDFDKRNASLDEDKKDLVAIKLAKSQELEMIKLQMENLSVLEDSDWSAEVNSWKDEEKKQFLNKKIKRIEILWIPSKNCHIVEITFSAGQIYTEVVTVSDGKVKNRFDSDEFTKKIFLREPSYYNSIMQNGKLNIVTKSDR